MANCGYTLSHSTCSTPVVTGWQTFTPTVTLVGGAGNTVPEYTTNDGRYCQIGDTIFVEVHLDGDGGDEGAGTGVINIALPTTAGASKVDGDSWVPVGTYRNGTSEWIVSGIIAQSASTVALAYNDSASNVSNITGADQNNTTRCIRLSFTYEVD